MKATRIIVKIVLFIAIVAVGVMVFKFLTSTKHEPEKNKVEAVPTIVAALEAEASEKPVVVTAMGSVIPARSIVVLPEVPGRIIYQNPELVPGGRIGKGQVIARIDPRDYDLAIQQQEAQVSAAQLNLAREQSLKAVAEKEWSLIQDEVKPTEQGRKLALREVQLKNAQVGVAAAKSGLDKAQLARSRASIRAPFNAIVIEEFVDVGQVVGQASKIATLVDADSFWVRAAVPMDRLSWIQLPGINSDLGSEVTVVQQAGPDLHVERTGRVIRLLGDLDPRGKMARVLVQVDDPFGSGEGVRAVHSHAISGADDGAQAGSEKDNPGPVNNLNGEKPTMPLLLGSYVTVHIQGPTLNKVLALPRMALRDRNRVWVKDEEDKLQIREVVVVWSRQDTVFVSGNLKAGEEVITSRISTPVEGMIVKTNGHGELDASEVDQVVQEGQEKAGPVAKNEEEARP